MNIPMVDLREQYHSLKPEIDAALQQVLESTRFILGDNVRALEAEIAAHLGVKHAIGVASGTDALHLALDAVDIGPGDEVITTPFTFIATAEATCYLGATPVFVDIDPDTFNIDLDAVEAAVTDRTRAILPVHLFGQPVNMPALMKLAQKHGLRVIEDCAQSYGAHINKSYTGGFGDLGAFSFFPSKNLGCYGDGGLVTTNSDELAQAVRVLRNHGSSKRYYHSVIGYNSRLDEMQAAILRVKLKHIDEYTAQRRRVAASYRQQLAGTGVQTPVEDGVGQHVYHQYTCLHPDRERIMAALHAAGIACEIYYPVPLHRQEVFAQEYAGVALPVTERVAGQCFSLPVYPELSDEKIALIADTIRRAL
jgi:dTDP-4-amino-4,6-dideoxygalactose transaminase